MSDFIEVAGWLIVVAVVLLWLAGDPGDSNYYQREVTWAARRQSQMERVHERTFGSAHVNPDSTD